MDILLFEEFCEELNERVFATKKEIIANYKDMVTHPLAKRNILGTATIATATAGLIYALTHKNKLDQNRINRLKKWIAKSDNPEKIKKWKAEIKTLEEKIKQRNEKKHKKG